VFTDLTAKNGMQKQHEYIIFSNSWKSFKFILQKSDTGVSPCSKTVSCRFNCDKLNAENIISPPAALLEISSYVQVFQSCKKAL
jgi:hypothetical protein